MKLNIYTMKKPQSRQASPSCWIALERSLGLEEMRREKSMIGTFCVSQIMESSGVLGQMQLEGIDLTASDSTDPFMVNMFSQLRDFLPLDKRMDKVCYIAREFVYALLSAYFSNSHRWGIIQKRGNHRIFKDSF